MSSLYDMYTSYYVLDITPINSSVGIATCYGLEGPVIESRWGARFSAPVQNALGHTQIPIQWVPGLLPGGNAAGA